jgi:hypothetical protein
MKSISLMKELLKVSHSLTPSRVGRRRQMGLTAVREGVEDDNGIHVYFFPHGEAKRLRVSLRRFNCRYGNTAIRIFARNSRKINIYTSNCFFLQFSLFCHLSNNQLTRLNDALRLIIHD